MVYASSISPERRANLRRLRSEFETAFDAVVDHNERSSPEYLLADDRYRAWIKAIDAVALALLDDIDAFEATPPRGCSRTDLEHVWSEHYTPVDVGQILSGMNEHQTTHELIGATTPSTPAADDRTPRSRAMRIIGNDRAARLWSVRLSPGHQRVLDAIDSATP